MRASVDYKRFFSLAEVQDARVALTDRGSTITPQQENFRIYCRGMWVSGLIRLPINTRRPWRPVVSADPSVADA